MKLKQMAVAFLFNEAQDVLFLHKKENSTFLPGMLVPIGGHMEGNEIGTPDETCLREIKEETSLTDHDISHLKLRYIIHRMKGYNEIRTQYVYFGNVKNDCTIIDSDEGKLSWISSKEITGQNVTETTKEIIKHYLEKGKRTNEVYVGTMSSSNGNTHAIWAILEDWEQPI